MRWILLVVAVLLLITSASATTMTVTIFATNSSDGNIYRAIHNSTFTDLRNGAGNGYDSTGATVSVYVQSDLVDNSYYRIYRTATIFDTSILPDDATITSATIGLYRFSQYTTLGDTGLNIVKFDIDGALSADDYDNFGNTTFSTDQNASTITTAKYYNFSLDALGIENISKTSTSGFGSRFGFDTFNLSPEWASGGGKYSGAAWRPADYVAYPPFIEITYTTPSEAAAPYTDWPWCAKQDIFFWNLSDTISGYRVADHRPEINNTDYTHVEVSSGTGSVNLGSWITPRGSPGVTVIGPGLWRFRSYLNVSSAVGTTVYEYKLFNRSSDGTETDLFYGHSITADVNSLTPIEYLTSYARRNYTTLFSGDRLVIKINASTTSVAARDAWISLAGNSQASMVESGYYICTNPQASAVAQTPINPAIPFIAMTLSILALAYHRRRA